MDWLLQTTISHRGLHKGVNIPENSCLAFEDSKSKSYGIELDIQLTKDNQ